MADERGKRRYKGETNSTNTIKMLPRTNEGELCTNVVAQLSLCCKNEFVSSKDQICRKDLTKKKDNL